MEFGEWLEEEVLLSIPHRHWVFSLPKCLRIYFMYDRTLLPGLSRCAWKTLSAYLKESSSVDGAIPGAVIAVQTFGDLQNYHPHLHIIATDGCFLKDGSFAVSHAPDAESLAAHFRHLVLRDVENINIPIIILAFRSPLHDWPFQKVRNSSLFLHILKWPIVQNQPESKRYSVH